MDIRKRKIGFYYLILKTDDSNLLISTELQRIINFVIVQEKVARRTDISTNKFCFIEESTLSEDGLTQTIIFKSAIHSYRAPLLDRETINERDNPKTLSEGESQKTHFIIKYKDGDAILIGEKFRAGLAAQQLVEYFNKYKHFYETIHNQILNYQFDYETIAKDNLDEELEKLNRVLSASVYVDKQVLGGEALNFSDRINSVQESIIIEIRASRTQSIKETAKDIIAKFNGGARVVNKVRIKGKNSSNNDITIDTDFIEKREYINAELNGDTGEVNSGFLLNQLTDIANTL